MVDFVRKRLQVFVSSTYTDLRDERQAAVEAILTAGHIPAGMELFTSGDESQMEVIKQWIQESDVFLLILGGRYGSVEPTSNKSYTQLEYEYAVSLGKPLFACVITDSALDNRVRSVGSSAMETTYSRELKVFRDLVLSKMVRFWDDFKDIKIAVGETLSTHARRDDLLGWVRASQEANMPALADEIARLSSENADLRNNLSNKTTIINNYLTYSEIEALLIKNELLEKTLQLREIYKDNLSIRRLELMMSEPEIKELIMLQIIRNVNGISDDPVYVLTDTGRVFINKLEAERLKKYPDYLKSFL